jgi:hypothetical protein
MQGYRSTEHDVKRDVCYHQPDGRVANLAITFSGHKVSEEEKVIVEDKKTDFVTNAPCRFNPTLLGLKLQLELCKE